MVYVDTILTTYRTCDPMWSHFIVFLLLSVFISSLQALTKFHNVYLNGKGYRCSSFSRSFSLNGRISDWLRTEGVEDKDFKVKIDDDGIAMAMGPIKKGDVMLTLPMGICIDVEKANSRLPTLTVDKLKTGSVGYTAILLLLEKISGEKSKYYKYISTLPSKVPGLFGWTEEEQEEFCRSTTRRVRSQITAIESDYQLLKDMRLLPTEVDKTSFFWAVGTVKARAVYIQGLGQSVLVPGMDFMKFDPFSTSEPFSAGAGMFGGKVVKVLADRSYVAGQEVFISYGLKSSAECMEDHGIVPILDEQDSSCELFLAIDETDKFSDDKLNVLENELLGAKIQVDLEADKELELDPLLLQFTRLKSIEGKDAFILEACFSNTIWDTLREPFSRPNEIKAMSYIMEQCKKSLDDMPSLEDDREIAKGIDRKALFSRLRLQEQAALKGTLAKLQMELDKLTKGPDDKEYYQERRLRELRLDRPLEGNEIVLSGDRNPTDDDY